MGALVSAEGIRFLQRSLCSAGCYAGPLDGVWNAAIDAAERKLQTLSESIASSVGRFDPRSERHVATLHPTAQTAARQLLSHLRAQRTDARIISGTRTYEEQDALFLIGRSGDGAKPVTN